MSSGGDVGKLSNEVLEALEEAWNIICNVSEHDKQSTRWIRAAESFRDKYFQLITEKPQNDIVPNFFNAETPVILEKCQSLKELNKNYHEGVEKFIDDFYSQDRKVYPIPDELRQLMVDSVSSDKEVADKANEKIKECISGKTTYSYATVYSHVKSCALKEQNNEYDKLCKIQLNIDEVTKDNVEKHKCNCSKEQVFNHGCICKGI